MVRVASDVTAWLVRYGAPVLFFAQVCGIVGVPIPDELLLTVAGALVARGVMHGPSTAFAALAGCLAGITVSYTIGRVIGATVLERRARRHAWAVNRARRYFERFGTWLLTFGYFIPGVRHLTAIIAGSGRLEYRTFAAYAYPGGALWCTVFLSIGYYAGDRWPDAVKTAQANLTLLALGIGGAIMAYALLRRRATRS
jgi:membrane protein DedA with SNARE-associated domain